MRLVLLFALLALIAGCEPQQKPVPAPASTGASIEAQSAAAEQLSDQLWQIAAQSIDNSNLQCAQLSQAVQQLLRATDEKNLHATQQAWLALHGSVIENATAFSLATVSPDLFAPLAGQINRIDSQPIAPGFIDAVAGYPYSGLVHDFSTPINRATLTDQHQLTDDSEALLGLHVLEFLLFGENGERQAEDFIATEQGTDSLSPQQRPQNRRRDLLALTSKILCDDLEALTNLWRSKHSSISSAYYQLPPLGRLMLWREAMAAAVNTLAQNECVFAADLCQNPQNLLSGLEGLLASTRQFDASLSMSDEQLYAIIKDQLAEVAQNKLPDTAILLDFIAQTPEQTPPSDSKSPQ
ncbi:imelysin family protein [Gilvimarinus sp. DA14]|uniref:imelysin family protein n=1 Tax=Gilvimarinus sp. DA14 TaxID=2956798 RepID=UPI0020B7DCA5|nr:imelysin family protein [Gilvimarinus sp. DA14]UTF61697.1 hypothetical protein NHM04_07875 [Gilvimarinus sp. DA14]